MTKIVIYNETPKVLSDIDALCSVLTVMNQEKSEIYGGPYEIFERNVVTVIQNKKSITFRVAARINKISY